MELGIIGLGYFVLFVGILSLLGTLGAVIYLLNKFLEWVNCISKRYIPSEEGSFNVEITKDYVEGVAKDYNYVVADYPKLMEYIKSELHRKTNSEGSYLMEGVILDLLTDAEVENLVVSVLKDEISNELVRTKYDENMEEYLDMKHKAEIAQAEEDMESIKEEVLPPKVKGKLKGGNKKEY